MTNKEKGIRIRTQIIRDVVHHPRDISNHIAKIFNITPQAVYNHIKRLEKKGYIASVGKGKGKRYSLGVVRNYSVNLPLIEQLFEDVIWRNSFAFILEGIAENVVDICHYGFTEMVNNVIDHSAGENIEMHIFRDKEKIQIFVIDDGEGISTIGQAFADEIFRVYANKNPDIVLIPINTTEDVDNMIQLALGN